MLSPTRVAAEITDLVGGDPDEVLRISAKTGEGVGEVLEAIVARIPSPDGDADAPPRALIFDSEFDPYRGVVAYVRLIDGGFERREPIVAMQAGTEAEIDELGYFQPEMTAAQRDERRRGGIRDHRHQGRGPPAGRGHAHLAPGALRPTPFPATAR